MSTPPQSQSPSLTGAVTLLGTDIVGSAGLWEREPEAMQEALKLHDRLVHASIADHGGYVFKTTGDGCLAIFSQAADAARCALTIQASVIAQEWPTSHPLRVRAALHSGQTVRQGDDHFGPTVNRLARLIGEAQPGTTVLSLATAGLLEGKLPAGAATRELGARSLRGIAEPMLLWELLAREGSEAAIGYVAAGRVRTAGAWPSTGRLFVGRTAELAAVLAKIGKGSSLMTVTGPGGVGKTSLICRAVESAAPTYRDGCVYVDCQSFDSESEVALAICQALGGSPGTDGAEDAMIDLLRPSRLLLALDCYEALADCSTLPARILDCAPGVDILVGSRAVLGLERETELPLGPMPLKQEGATAGTAEELLIALALRSDATFEVEASERHEIATICGLLDGIPLLLTIAASRLRHVGLTELREQLEETGAARLTGTQRDTNERHAGIRSVVASSVRLLDKGEAEVLRDLAVFRGGALYRDVEDLLGPRHSDLERCVYRLRDHSLLLAENTRGRKRYRMLDTIREAVCAEGPLDPGLLEAHARLFTHHAERLGTVAARGEVAEVRYLLLTETGNFKAAVEHSVETGDAAVLERLYESLGGSLQDCGLYDDYTRLAEATRRVAGPKLQARLLGLDGALAARRGNRSAASREWTRRAALCAEIGDHEGQADALLDLAELALNQGDLRTAAQQAATGLLVSRRHGTAGHFATSWAVGAEVAVARGNLATALRRARQAERHDDGSKLAIYVQLACCRAYGAAGLSAESLACCLRGIALSYRHSSLLSLIRMLQEAGAGFEQSGDTASAAIAWSALIELDRDIGAGRASEARRSLARAKRLDPGAVEDAERLVKGSGWEAGVESLVGPSAV